MKAIITGSSKKDIQLLITTAKRIGLKARFLTNDEVEDTGLAMAIEQGQTGERIDIGKFLKSLS